MINQPAGEAKRPGEHAGLTLLSRASAHKCDVRVIWRDRCRLALLGLVVVIEAPHAAVRCAGGRSRRTQGCLPTPKLVDIGPIGSYFESLSDPRHTRNRDHLLTDIAVFAVCGIILRV